MKETDVAADASTVDRMLRDIEFRVLEEVSLGRARFISSSVLVAVVCTTAILWWLDAARAASPVAANHVPTVATAMLLFAAIASGLALAVRRYRWCCAAAYCCGLASVLGIGAFWWLRTGRPGASLTWLTLADVALVALTIMWLVAIATPIARSQPDMKRARA